MTSRVYRDVDGNECSLQELCRKAPEWAASVIETLEARLEKYTDPGVVHPLQAPGRVWVQWLPRLRGAMVYLRPPAILDGTIGNYVLTNTVGHGGEVRGDGSRVCLDCGHPLTDADRRAPVCPYCGCA